MGDSTMTCEVLQVELITCPLREDLFGDQGAANHELLAKITVTTFQRAASNRF